MRVVRIVALGIVLAYVVATVAVSIWKPELPDVPTPSEAAQAQERDRQARERDFVRRIAIERQIDRLQRELADQEIRRAEPETPAQTTTDGDGEAR
jgi:hypothetical protein